MRLLLISVLLSFMLTNCPSESDTELVDMTATVNPEEAGVVNPPEGTYFSGREINVETEPSGEEWEFTGWSGDTSASESSLSFNITRNMNLVANYEIPLRAQAFSNTVTVSDGINSKDVIFGMNADATSGYDSGIDEDLPPRPPQGSFYRRFNIPDYGLKEDYRSIRSEQTVWELEFAPESGRSITLNWDLSGTAHIGALTLTDDVDNPSIEVNMKSSTSYEVTDQSVNTLYILSN